MLQSPPSADVYVAEVVLEEKGGAGSEHLVKALQPDVVIIGEATKNELCIGHRGRVELAVTAMGKSVHASVPDRGINPHYAIAAFLLRLKELSMQSAQGLTATVAPTIYRTDQTSSNVTPGEVTVHLDWRKVPGETNESILKRLHDITDETIYLSIVEEKLRSYTGMDITMKKNREPYYLDPATPVVKQAKHALEKALGREVHTKFWDFVTDSGAFDQLGIPVIGFSPCEEEYAHTAIDRVRIDLMEQALQCYPPLVAVLQENTK